MISAPKAGLLPFYLQLYDDVRPNLRSLFEPFIAEITAGLNKRGIDVVRADVCRRAPEFEQAVRFIEDSRADCILTLHLAYSPSLESIQALTRTNLPVVVLDATMDAEFGPAVKPDRIMFNHGIHGVMDMASMLRRMERPFAIVAGHVGESNVLDRAESVIRGAHAAGSVRSAKALRIGEPFRGMGDFSVNENTLRRVLGVAVAQAGLPELEAEIRKVAEPEVVEEMRKDQAAFDCAAPEAVHRRSVRVGLGLRRMLEAGQYSAFSMNFLAFDKAECPANAVPFLEASKAMARGIGYAGEGDVLTAALVGAIERGFGNATFTEIFCPDWRGNSLFLSHMGEVNPEIAADRPRLIEKDFPYTPAENPAVITCAPRPGRAVFVNLAPAPRESFTLIVAPVEVLGDTENDEMKASVRGWIRPQCPIPHFLEQYSTFGGTHHSALVLGDKAEGVMAMGRFLGLECKLIQ